MRIAFLRDARRTMNMNVYWEMLWNGMEVLNSNGNKLDVERQF